MGEKVFNLIQYGLESAHGTPVPATDKWPGKIKVPTDRKPKYPEESLGIRSRAQRSVIYQLLADGIDLSMDDSVFQKLPMLLSMALKGAITPVEQSVGEGDYLWDFTPSLTGSNAQDSITLEFGDDTQAYESEYCLAKSVKFSGKMGGDEAVKVSASLFGKQITPTTFTPSLALAKGEPIIANMVKIYIDGTWATLGTTNMTGLMIDWSTEIINGLHPKFRGGSLSYSSHGEGYLDMLTTFTFEGNSDADAIFDAFRAKTEKAIRISVEGAAIGDGDPHSLIIDGFGTFEDVVPLGSEQDGDNLHTAVFHTYADLESTRHQLAVQVTTDSNSL